MNLRVDLELEPDADAAELDDATLSLREDLLELDVDAVKRPASGPPPPGAKAVDAAVLGTLLVTGGKEAVAAVVRTIERWVGRGKGRIVRVQFGDDAIE